MSAISAQSTYIPTSIIKNLSDIPANLKWKIMVPHMAYGGVSFGMDLEKIFARYFKVRFSRVLVGKRPQGSDGCLLFRLTDPTRAGFHTDTDFSLNS